MSPFQSKATVLPSGESDGWLANWIGLRDWPGKAKATMRIKDGTARTVGCS
jgi:hypothetical protein